MDDNKFDHEFSTQERQFARYEHLRTEYHERRRLTALESLCRRDPQGVTTPDPPDAAGKAPNQPDRK